MLSMRRRGEYVLLSLTLFILYMQVSLPFTCRRDQNGVNLPFHFVITEVRTARGFGHYE